MARLYQTYDDQHPPIQCFMPDSKWYKESGSFTPKGILWHDTGCDNPWLKRYVQPADNDPNREKLLALIGKNTYGNDWEHGGKDRQAGLNCWVGKLQDGKVTTLQSGPWTKRPWGCGSGSTGRSLNDTHIQWEICEDAKTDKAYFADVYEESIQVSAYLCKKFGIDPHGTITYKGVTVPTICCHWDSYCLNPSCGSGHDDIYDWSVMYDYLGIQKSSTNINDPYNNLIMKRIRDDIAKAMKDPEKDGGWVQKDGKWYYYDKDGQMVKSAWQLYKGGWYYLGPDGAMLTGLQTINSYNYYLYPDGHRASIEWIDGLFYDATGQQHYKKKGAWKSNSKGKKYKDSAGWYPSNRSMRIDGVDYTFDKDGYVMK